jgi:hypothetical protein
LRPLPTVETLRTFFAADLLGWTRMLSGKESIARLRLLNHFSLRFSFQSGHGWIAENAP